MSPKAKEKIERMASAYLEYGANWTSDKQDYFKEQGFMEGATPWAQWAERLAEEMEALQLNHVHNETNNDFRLLGDDYGYCSICHSKFGINEGDYAKDILEKYYQWLEEE